MIHRTRPHLELTDEAAQPSAAELEAAGQNSMFGDAPEPEPKHETKPEHAIRTGSGAAQPYRVLARKYRPQTFAELIGQDAMVRTLANAIARDRLAHAFLMTGVRGVGKTSTARLIAKALNCIGPDGQGGPTINPCGECEPCVAIAEGRHIDVIEMDAASHTGVDDVREIIEAVRYAAVSARYKIYIIDEVHMLSRNAFNALAQDAGGTARACEIPVRHHRGRQAAGHRAQPHAAVRSCAAFQPSCSKRISPRSAARKASRPRPRRCTSSPMPPKGRCATGCRSSTRRSPMPTWRRAAQVTAERVRDMLGLADHGAQRRLFAHLLEGDGKAVLAAVDDQYALGVEPLALMRALMDLTHRIALAQVADGEADAPTAEEREQLADWAERLDAGTGAPPVAIAAERA